MTVNHVGACYFGLIVAIHSMQTLIINLAVAFGIGLLIGVERERRKGIGQQRAPAGIRTFTLTSLLGGLSYSLGTEVVFVVCSVFIAAATLLGYSRSAEEDPGLTTEVALLVTFLLGALAIRTPALAAGLAVIVAITLASRDRLHRFVNAILSEQEVHDGLILAAAVLVVLPLLPDRNLGPFEVFNPHALWRIAVLVMSISALGHVAIRLLGVRYGLPLAGLASGFVSSAMTIGVMGARAARDPQMFRAAVSGAVLSTVATVIQLVVVLAATSAGLLRDLIVPLLLSGIVAGAYGVGAIWRNTPPVGGTSLDPGRAFDLKVALIFSALVAGVLFLSTVLVHWLGSAGVIVAAGLAGFADAHSAAISVGTLTQAEEVSHVHASIAVLLGLSTNTITKVMAARLSGDAHFMRALLPGLLVILLTAWIGLLLELFLKQV